MQETLFYIYLWVAGCRFSGVFLAYLGEETFSRNLFDSTLAAVLWPVTFVNRILG